MPLPLLPRNINDPTAQDVRERALIKEFKRRITIIGRGVKAVLDRQQPTSITLNALDIEVKKYEFNIDEAQYDFLGSEMDDLIDRLMLEGADRGSLWIMTGYVQPAYQQGTAMAWGNLKAQSKDYRLSRPDLESILTSAPYRRRLGYIKAREFEEMRSMTADLKRDYKYALLQGMAQGLNPLAIADKISETTDRAISDSRRVARTEITTALKRARLDEAEDASERLGMRIMMMQISALSPTTRLSHAARHAKLYTFEQVRAWMETVPNMINCYLPGTEVAGRFVAGSKSRYDGPAVRIVTASGKNITLTVNHPVPTDKGMLSAAHVRKGFNLFAYSGEVELPVGVGNLNGQLANPRIEDVFSSMVDIGYSGFTGVSAVDFHGDGAFMNEDIHVVNVQGHLPLTRNPETAKLFDYFKLKHPYFSSSKLRPGDFALSGILLPSAASLSHGGVTESVFPCISGVPHDSSVMPSAIREVGGVKPLVNSYPGHLDIPGYGEDGLATHMPSVDLFDGVPSSLLPGLGVIASPFESNPNASGADSKFCSDLLERFASSVSLDEVVDVEFFHFSGHVYDLEELSGLMLANNLILRNCKCSFVEILVSENGTPLTPAIIDRAKAMRPDAEE